MGDGRWGGPASHMQACTPPQPIRLVVLGLGVGVCGGAKETAPPAVVLSPSSRRQASPDRRPKCIPTPDARLPSRFLRSAIVLSPSTRLVGFARESVPSSTLEFSLESCVVSVSLSAPPTPLPLSPYNCTFPSTLPPNGRVFLWSPRAPLPRWTRTSGRLLSRLWSPSLSSPPPTYSMAIYSGSRSPF